MCRLIIIKKRSNTNFAYDLRIYKILRFQIVALPRLESWDVMIVVLKSAQIETEWRSIPFFEWVKKAKDVLEGAVFILFFYMNKARG